MFCGCATIGLRWIRQGATSREYDEAKIVQFLNLQNTGFSSEQLLKANKATSATITKYAHPQTPIKPTTLQTSVKRSGLTVALITTATVQPMDVSIIQMLFMPLRQTQGTV
jgi:hypothetical protein